MPMNRETKQAQVNKLRDRFDRATAAILLDFRGVDVETVTDLRSRFREVGVEYAVVKNNLVKRAVVETEYGASEAFNEHLSGPTAVAWSYEEPSVAAKIIKTFLKEKEDAAEDLTIKCGVFDSKVMSAQEVTSVLATMPGKDEIRAMLLATLQAPAQNLLQQFNAPGQNFAYVLSARERSETT